LITIADLSATLLAINYGKPVITFDTKQYIANPHLKYMISQKKNGLSLDINSWNAEKLEDAINKVLYSNEIKNWANSFNRETRSTDQKIVHTIDLFLETRKKHDNKDNDL
jgi:hypothetical protein